MELQWPLILFTLFVAWSAGLFATQAVYAIKGEGVKSQLVAWIVSAILLVAGGIAVFLHLQHWERIFNGFGHITSGITQELIAIVVLAVVAVIYLVYMRKSDNGATVPRWVAIVAVAVSALLVAIMAHSYMMPARPAWNNVLWVLAVLGNACILGPATMAVIVACKNEATPLVGKVSLIGAAANAVTAIAYAIALQFCAGSFMNVDFHYDSTHPTQGLLSVQGAVGDQALLLWLGAVVVGAIIPLVIAFLAKRKGDANTWKVCGALTVVAAVLGAVCMRVVFYNLGFSMFMFY